MEGGFIKSKFSRSIIKFLIFCLMFEQVFFSAIDYVNAVDINAIMTYDKTDDINAQLSQKGDQSKFSWEKALENFKKNFSKTSSQILGRTLYNTLTTIAKDTATYLGSGGEGQKPVFYTEGWGDYWNKVGDNALGTFIEETMNAMGETLNDGNSHIAFNICKPNADIALKIGLGLQGEAILKKPDCSWTEMKNNWSSEYERLKDMKRPEFLGKFSKLFYPESNDLGIALSLHTSMVEYEKNKKEESTAERQNIGGWIDNLNPISNLRTSPPDWDKLYAEGVLNAQLGSLKFYTGNALADASTIFLNQLAITAFNTAMKNLLTSDVETIEGYDFSAFDFEADTSRMTSENLPEKIRKNIPLDFSTKSDYSIVSDLMMCPDPNHAGPTECVIDNKFADAIIENKTVAQALEDGNFNSNGAFGFSASGLEPSYLEGYPYRSMKILKKYRIIPVGWELAAQYIHGVEGKSSDESGAYSISKMIQCFSPDDEYGDFHENWCDGLVDPNWVLKAPLNYCKREGYGPTIRASSISGQGSDSELIVTRSDDYCADEQSCIKEAHDGSCELYGYCLEEKRKWNFDSDSCDPNFNTCMTYKARNGSTISYLENTLDYGDCSDDSAIGCRKYSLISNGYDALSDEIDWDNTDENYFNKNIEECSEDSEGCHGFIRTVNGENLYKNGSFEDPIGNYSDDAFHGYYSEQINTALRGFSITTNFPLDYSSLDGLPITFSLYAKNCGDIILNYNGHESTGFSDAHWQMFSVTSAFSSSEATVQGSVNGCLIDAVKYEVGEIATGYRDYADIIEYEKFMPDYLNGLCYGENSGFYEILPNAPSKCFEFARTCTAEEAGCDLYTSVNTNMQIAAKVAYTDYCYDECVGYNAYNQTNSFFETNTDEQFMVPSNQTRCNAESAGCDEFTNLQKEELGGEAIEYFTEMRKCVNSDNLTGTNQCKDFYAWEGDNETGYQLKVYKLMADSSGNPDGEGVDYNNLVCFDSDDMTDDNPLCRELFDGDGNKFYVYIENTTACTDNCVPYRKSIDPASSCDNTCGTITSPESCNCKGGICNANDECIYNAIPEESKKCSAAQNGCREYVGPQGANYRNILVDTFEKGTSNGWYDGANVAEYTSEAVIRGGHSITDTDNNGGTISKEIGSMLKNGKDYVLSFMIKGSVTSQYINASANAYFTEDNFEHANSVNSDSWEFYKMSIHNLTGERNDTDSISITLGSGSYIDNITLTEISDRYYLIKKNNNLNGGNASANNEWDVPVACDNEYGSQSDTRDTGERMLGCDQYTDRLSQTHYLRSFDQLCLGSAIGCELMIDTQNSSDLTGDNFQYAVFDPDKKCSDSDKGCQRMGKYYYYITSELFEDVYLKNDPDTRANVFECTSDQYGCDEWTSSEGGARFKDPGDHVCEYRAGDDGKKDWYTKKVKKCDLNKDGLLDASDKLIPSDPNSIIPACLKDSDCDNLGAFVTTTCMLDERNVSCPVSGSSPLDIKTFGYGGSGAIVNTPMNDSRLTSNYGIDSWAGLCPASESGCSEYIDPISSFSTNLLYNGDFSLNLSGTGADGWTNGDQDVESFTINSLYRFAGSNSTGGTTYTLNCDGVLYELGADGILAEAPGSNSVSLSIVNSDYIYSKNVYFDDNITKCTVDVNNNNPDESYSVELKKVINDYQLKQDLEKGECGGVVDPNDGCVLFNERTILGDDNGGYAQLNMNADNISVNGAPGTNSPFNANSLIKVSPDRVCGKWLSCNSYLKNDAGKDVCLNVTMCNGLNSSNSCNSFPLNSDENNAYHYDLVAHPEASMDKEAIKNLSGYSMVGYFGYSGNKRDYKQISSMEQIGNKIYFEGGTFEVYDFTNNYPSGWVYDEGDWGSNVFRVIDNPIDANRGIRQTSTSQKTSSINSSLGICYKKSNVGDECQLYTPEGKAFLMVGADEENFNALSDYIDVGSNSDYILSGYMNTKHLDQGQGVIEVIEDALTGSGYTQLGEVTLQAGEEWNFNSISFQPTQSTIRIRLKARGGNTGAVYFDDVQILPALEVKDGLSTAPADEVSDYISNQSCRLYPSEDALSCTYIDEDSGAIYNGWKGYCLEYDQYPGDSDACLLWYPVDKVRGDNILGEPQGGYLGDYPLYYCSTINANFDIVERRDAVNLLKKRTGGCLSIWEAIGAAVLAIYGVGLAFIGSLFGAAAYLGGGGALYSYGIESIKDLDSVITFNLISWGVVPTSDRTGKTGNADYKCQGCGCYSCPEMLDRSSCTIPSGLNDADQLNYLDNNDCCDPDFACPHGYTTAVTMRKKSCAIAGKKIYYYFWCMPEPDDLVYIQSQTTANEAGVAWYKYDGDLQSIEHDVLGYDFDESDSGLRIFNHDTQELMQLSEYEIRCDQIVQTVTTAGTNKSWSGRVHETSDYIVDNPSYIGDNKVDYRNINSVDPFSYYAGSSYGPFNEFYRDMKDVDRDGFVDGLNYSYRQLPVVQEEYPDKPFGAMSIPYGVSASSPENWTQSASGLPYSCRGRRCPVLGVCETTRDICVYTGNNTANNPNPDCLTPDHPNPDGLSGYDCRILADGTPNECKEFEGFKCPGSSQSLSLSDFANPSLEGYDINMCEYSENYNCTYNKEIVEGGTINTTEYYCQTDATCKYVHGETSVAPCANPLLSHNDGCINRGDGANPDWGCQYKIQSTDSGWIGCCIQQEVAFEDDATIIEGPCSFTGRKKQRTTINHGNPLAPICQHTIGFHGEAYLDRVQFDTSTMAHPYSLLNTNVTATDYVRAGYPPFDASWEKRPWDYSYDYSLDAFNNPRDLRKAYFDYNVPQNLPSDNYAQKNADDPNFGTTAKSYLKRIFAKSYGVWKWDPVNSKYVKQANETYGWDVPTDLCQIIPDPSTSTLPPAQLDLLQNQYSESGLQNRPLFPNDYCGIPPMIQYLSVDKTVVSNEEDVNLIFYAKVDQNQKPLVSYSVDWGDGNQDIMSGVQVNDRPCDINSACNSTNHAKPFSFYKKYNYWELRRLYNNQTVDSIYCLDNGTVQNWQGTPLGGGHTCTPIEPCCFIQPKVRVKDNWGWCSNDASFNQCDWQPLQMCISGGVYKKAPYFNNLGTSSNNAPNLVCDTGAISDGWIRVDAGIVD